MFTGLIEATGIIRAARRSGGGMRLLVKAPFAGELEQGESVAVDGVCLTVVEKSSDGFEADASGETLARTTLGALRAGSRVNLERGLRFGDRLGGHMVSGHVDTVGRIVRSRAEGDFLEVQIEPAEPLGAAIVLKGSIAVDGISLTVSDLDRKTFSVTLIPETMAATTLPGKGKGAEVNLETDMIGKYVMKYLAQAESPGADGSALRSLLDTTLNEGG